MYLYITDKTVSTTMYLTRVTSTNINFQQGQKTAEIKEVSPTETQRKFT